MDVVGKKVENQVQFWSLLGPFFVLLAIAILLFKVSSHWYFPLSALIGIPLCVKWKMKGMAAALCCLFLLAGITYQSLELDDRYWHVGLSLALAFSFIVLTLSWEEVQGLVSKLQLESQSRLDNFLLLDEKWKSAELEWSLEKEKTKNDMIVLSKELAGVQEDKQTFYKLAQLAKDELIQVRGQHDLLLQDLLYKKQHIAQLHERLEESEITIQGFVDSDSEKQIQALTESLALLEREKETFKAKMVLAQEEVQAYQIEKEQLRCELQICQEREKLCLLDQQNLQQEKLKQQNVFQDLQNKCNLLDQEKQALIQSQAKIQLQYEQMHQLEMQQKQLLQQSQQKIKELENKIHEEEKQKQVFQLMQKEFEEKLQEQQNQAKHQQEQYKINLQALQKQLQEEKNRIEAQFKQHEQQWIQQNQHEQKDLQERYQQACEEWLKICQDLDLANQNLNDLRTQEKNNQFTIQQLQQQIEESKRVLVKQSVEQKQMMESLKIELEQALQQTQMQLEQTKQKLDAKKSYQGKLPQNE